SDLMQAIADRGRLFLDRMRGGGAVSNAGFEALGEMLLSSRGEASGVARASEMVARWEAADAGERRAILRAAAEGFGIDHARLGEAAARYQQDPGERTAAALRAAGESRRMALFRRLNMAPGAMKMLVEMRAQAIAEEAEEPALAAVDTDLADLL